MGLLVMLLTLSGLVFSTTVEAHRKAGASIDVSRNLRAITEQLSADFRGLRKDAPLAVWFNAVDTNGDTVPDTHYDTIHFFADGDFQATQSPIPNKMIYGNIARIYYGHANSQAAVADFATQQILARRCHILTADNQLFMAQPIPILGSPPVYINFTNPVNFNFALENYYEHDTISLNEWLNVLNFSTANADHFLKTVMFDPAAADGNISRPFVDIAAANGLWNLFSQGVLEMQIQWAYTVRDLDRDGSGNTPILPTDTDYFTGVRWWPSTNPDGLGVCKSDFDTMKGGFPIYAANRYQFGAYFGMNVTPGDNWFGSRSIIKRGWTQTLPGWTGCFRSDFYPRALKFTFVLKDSNGIFAGGKTFTHIVYLDN